MGCGCGRRARAKLRGEEILGYRITLPDGTVVPAEGQPPFLSVAEARREVRILGGGTVYAENRKTA